MSRREDFHALPPRRGLTERRKNDRRRGSRSGLERRQAQRRHMARGAAGLMLAGLTFASGALKSMHRHHEDNAPDSAATSSLGLSGSILEGPGGLIAPSEDKGGGGALLPVYLNDAVEKALTLYTGHRRVDTEQALSRGQLYLGEIQQVFQQEGLPPELAYVAMVESEFKPEARSQARARGVWQFMPATARQMGLSQNFWIDERSDPWKSTRAAAQYLKYLHEKFDNWELALAAYNAGEGTVARAMQKHRTSDFWRLSQARALPRETRDYVPRIYAAILLARQPDKYGLEVKAQEPLDSETLVVPPATDLRVVAKCAGVELAAIDALNPALKTRVTPLRTPFELRVPEGKAAETEACLTDLSPAELTGVRTHVVSSGQTLASVAKRYGTRVADIRAVNNVSPRRLAKGTELIIPKPGVLGD